MLPHVYCLPICWQLLVVIGYPSAGYSSYKLFLAINCHALLAPYNGVIIRDSNQSYTVESTIEFSCSDGYSVTGSSTLVCQEDGSWSGSVPLCEGSVSVCIPVVCFDYLSQ